MKQEISLWASKIHGDALAKTFRIYSIVIKESYKKLPNRGYSPLGSKYCLHGKESQSHSTHIGLRGKYGFTLYELEADKKGFFWLTF